MFGDADDYKGLLQAGFSPHHGLVEINSLRTKRDDSSSIGLSTGYALRYFFYDILYLEAMREEFQDQKYITKEIDLWLKKLPLQLQEKYDGVKSGEIFGNYGIARLYEEPLKKYFDDLSFFQFSDDYYLKKGMSFSSFGTEPDLKNQPSDNSYFKALKESAGKQDNQLKQLQEFMGENEYSMGENTLKKIYYVDSENNSNPLFYEIDIQSLLFMMNWITGGVPSNLYFVFDGHKIVRKYNYNEYKGFATSYGDVPEEFIQEGKYLILGPSLKPKRIE